MKKKQIKKERKRIRKHLQKLCDENHTPLLLAPLPLGLDIYTLRNPDGSFTRVMREAVHDDFPSVLYETKD